MLREMTNILGERPGDPVSILIAASVLKDDFPWLYELGMEAYRAVSSGDGQPTQAALHRLRRIAEVMLHGGFPMEEMEMDPRELDMFARALEHVLEGFGTEDPGSKR
jgi:hypothetical protein